MKALLFVDFYKKQIDYYNKTVHDILTKEIPFPKNRKEKRGIITLVVTGFIRLMYEGVASYLHNKTQKKAFLAMKNQVNLQRNKFISMVMYGI